MTSPDPNHIIKTRDDYTPVHMQPTSDHTYTNARFEIPADVSCSWATHGEPFGSRMLRPRIEPWLTALLQSEHLSLLIGSGLTHAIHKIATEKSISPMDPINFDVYAEQISTEANRIARAARRNGGNFEDDFSVANELLRGLEIIRSKSATLDSIDSEVETLRQNLDNAIRSLVTSILGTEMRLASAHDLKREEAFNYLVSFLMTFASRTGTRERLHIFTTNYDRYIEAGSDTAGLRLIDRFVGTLAPVFRASRLNIDMHYNPPGIRGEPRYLEGVAKFTKLHGSVDWVEDNSSIRRIGLPLGAHDIDGFLPASGFKGSNARRLMVYPNAAKDRETAHYPYVELFRDFATATCRPNSTLVCYGYSFGDDHINRVIEDMLTNPSAHLVVIAYSDPLGRIMNTYRKLGRHDQITLLIGEHLGDLKTLVDRYLPQSAIDRTTIRMAELLKSRWGSERTEESSAQEATSKEIGPAS